MGKSVLVDALWEKLSEIDMKLDEMSMMQKTLVSSQKTEENKPEFEEIKNLIIAEIKGEILILGLSNDSHFAANRQNIKMLNENITKVQNVVSHIRKQQREAAGSQINKNFYLNFHFFKLRKTSFAIAILGLLVFILTLFCMKQQNDYALLINKYQKWNISIQEQNRETEILEDKQLEK